MTCDRLAVRDRHKQVVGWTVALDAGFVALDASDSPVSGEIHAEQAAAVIEARLHHMSKLELPERPVRRYQPYQHVVRPRPRPRRRVAIVQPPPRRDLE